jgi:P-type Na+/K+ transporter
MPATGPHRPSPPDSHLSGQSNKPLSRPAHALTHRQLAAELTADTVQGLSPAEANSRLEEYGANDLGDAKGVQPLKIVISQIVNAMTMVQHRPPSSQCAAAANYHPNN